MIRLKEHIFAEEDTSKKCINYPNGKFKSYSQCEEDFWRSVKPPGLVPIWSVSNRENVTTKLYVTNITNSIYSYINIHDGTQKSSCLMPCSIIHIESQILEEKIPKSNNSVINLTFSQGVVVIKTSFVKFSFINFLSGLGGCMGLWLGLGFLQAIEMFITYVRCNK